MSEKRKINILFFIPYLSQEYGGVRQYAASLLKLIAGLSEDYSFYILHENSDPVILEIVAANPCLTIVSEKVFEVITVPKKEHLIIDLSKRVYRRLVKSKPKPVPVVLSPFEKLLKEYQIEIIHCPNQFIPHVKDIKLITTMHDVQELHFPEFFTPEVRAYRAVNYYDFIKRADAVIVSYGHVKKDIVKYFSKKEEDIYVLLLNMENLWFSKFKASDISFDTLAEIPSKYLFYPANTWQHKNHENLIRTAAWLKKEKQVYINIVFTGDHSNEWGSSLKELVVSLNLESQIIFLGIVDELTLYNLYQKAWGIVIPTLYEAGSFPLMESILMHLPVICSNVTSLPETIGKDDFIFDPFDVYDISEIIEKLWNDDDFRLACKENTYKQKDRLINTGALKIIEQIYNNLTN